jgi:hypothetical protein
MVLTASVALEANNNRQTRMNNFMVLGLRKQEKNVLIIDLKHFAVLYILDCLPN